MKIAHVMTPPALEHDALMLARYGMGVAGTGKLERRIVYNLMRHVEANGFRMYAIYDGEETTKVVGAGGLLEDKDAQSEARIKAAMELVFNLDEVSLRFRAKAGSGQIANREHGVLVVLGNGEDCIADWNYSEGDADGFNAIMEEFDAEESL